MACRDIQPIRLDEVQTEHCALPDGRRMAYGRYGKAGGTPILYFHGTPGSRYEAVLCDPWANAAGYEVFALDRPGCGQSSRAPGYRMLDWAADVCHFADALSLGKFGVIGFSGGGAYADTCAYAIPQRLLFVYDLGGWAPVAQVEALQDELAPLDRFFLRRASSFGPLFRVPFALIGLAARNLGAEGFARALRSSMGEDDRTLVLENENMRRFFRAVVAESFAQGSRGPADDAIRCYGDWGFALGEVEFPVQLWHGTDDRFASFRFAEYKHQQIADSSLRVFEGRGHLHLVTEYEALFRELRL